MLQLRLPVLLQPGSPHVLLNMVLGSGRQFVRIELAHRNQRRPELEFEYGSHTLNLDASGNIWWFDVTANIVRAGDQANTPCWQKSRGTSGLPRSTCQAVHENS